jgi:catechol 2,3-dioxygenase-like lactoylglutathione lyase family enzyme
MKANRLLIAASLAYLGISAGADKTPVNTPVPLARGSFFALSVADIEASTAWYHEKLGLEITLRPPRSGPASVVVLEGGGLIVELIQHDEAKALAKLNPPVGDAINLHGFFKAGFVVEDLDAALATLKSRGVQVAYGPFAAKEGRRANVIIQDNAGNLIHVFGK